MVVITHQMNVIEEICHRVAILTTASSPSRGRWRTFSPHPQTDIGRRLVYPNGVQIDRLPEARVIRIAFNGGSSYEPLIASLAIDCGVKVNILGGRHPKHRGQGLRHHAPGPAGGLRGGRQGPAVHPIPA